MTPPVDGSRRKPGRPRGVQAKQAILRVTLEDLVAIGFEALSIEAVAAWLPNSAAERSSEPPESAESS